MWRFAAIIIPLLFNQFTFASNENEDGGSCLQCCSNCLMQYERLFRYREAKLIPEGLMDKSVLENAKPKSQCKYCKCIVDYKISNDGQTQEWGCLFNCLSGRYRNGDVKSCNIGAVVCNSDVGCGDNCAVAFNSIPLCMGCSCGEVCSYDCGVLGNGGGCLRDKAERIPPQCWGCILCCPLYCTDEDK